MMYQLWEAESANLVGSYSSEAAALAIVRNAVKNHGREAAATLVLVQENARGGLKKISEGAALIDLAHTRAATPA